MPNAFRQGSGPWAFGRAKKGVSNDGSDKGGKII